MKKLKLKRGDKIEIEWIDTYTEHEETWMFESEHIDAELRIKTVTQYYGENKNYMYTYSSISFEDNLAHRIIKGGLHIPKGCIISIKKL